METVCDRVTWYCCGWDTSMTDGWAPSALMQSGSIHNCFWNVCDCLRPAILESLGLWLMIRYICNAWAVAIHIYSVWLSIKRGLYIRVLVSEEHVVCVTTKCGHAPGSL